MLLMLEDDNERIERFSAVLEVIAPSLPLMFWRSAEKMVREVEPFLPSTHPSLCRWFNIYLTRYYQSNNETETFQLEILAFHHPICAW